MFFSNLHLTDGILQREIRKHTISLLIEEFGELLNLPHEDKIIDIGYKANQYNFITDTCSLVKEKSPCIPYPFTNGYVHPES